MEERARFPAVAAKAGHYESFYVKVCQPGGGRGVWIRHTVHKRPGAEPRGSLWFVLFDREAEGPVATKVTVGAERLGVPAEGWIAVADAEIGPGYARSGGSLALLPVAEGGPERPLDVAWDLRFEGAAEPCRYLPAEWLYEAPLPRTKFVAPYPVASFEGELVLEGERIELRGWPGMIGHNWGSEHAERWLWIEANRLDGRSGDYLDCGAARVRLGGRATPWVPSGTLVLDGHAHRLGGLGAIRRAAIDESPSECRFVLPGRGVLVRGRVSAPAKDFVGWVYADPKGPEHHTVNCSVADLELSVERPGAAARRISVSGAAAYEFGMRETDHGIPIQPFADG